MQTRYSCTNDIVLQLWCEEQTLEESQLQLSKSNVTLLTKAFLTSARPILNQNWVMIIRHSKFSGA